jgi:hypothetical protein
MPNCTAVEENHRRTLEKCGTAIANTEKMTNAAPTPNQKKTNINPAKPPKKPTSHWLECYSFPPAEIGVEICPAVSAGTA